MDIGYEDLAGPSFDLDSLSRRHPILDAFKTKRTSNPRGTEQTQGVKGEIFNLHARNPYRGVTYFDEPFGVVFLLAVTVDHDYSVFTSRDVAGSLRPSESDYADFFESLNPIQSYETFLIEAEANIVPLLAAALVNPGILVEGVIGREFPVAVSVEVLIPNEPNQPVDIYVAVFFEGRARTLPLPRYVKDDLADILFPAAGIEEVDVGLPFFPPPRGKREGDLIYRWKRPSHQGESPSSGLDPRS